MLLIIWLVYNQIIVSTPPLIDLNMMSSSEAGLLAICYGMSKDVHKKTIHYECYTFDLMKVWTNVWLIT